MIKCTVTFITSWETEKDEKDFIDTLWTDFGIIVAEIHDICPGFDLTETRKISMKLLCSLRDVFDMYFGNRKGKFQFKLGW